MKFEKIIPSERLRPFVRYFAVSENEQENEFKVLPGNGIVLGFQYRGQLSTIANNEEIKLNSSGVTGIADTYKLFKNVKNTGTVLVYFTETGLAYFTSTPANELFNQSVSLENIFDNRKVQETEEKLSLAKTDHHRIQVIEHFLLTHLRNIEKDKYITEAIKLIYQSKGTIKIKELHERLFISQSPFEKRFRKLVGTTPKKFASIVRFNTALKELGHKKSLTEICYENNFFDQSHFIRDFKQYSGETPENFKRLL